MAPSPTVPPGLEEVLAAAQARGWIGPSPLGAQIAHSLRFAVAWTAVAGTEAPGHAVDLGAGGGLPGLVLATVTWPSTTWTLLEASMARWRHLHTAVATLGLADRVTAVHARAEAHGREARGAADLVTARSFGPPAVTAECALPLLRPGGLALVSEPPSSTTGDRWPATGLGVLGAVYRTTVAGIAVLEAIEPAPERFPRRSGVPAKRPLF